MVLVWEKELMVDIEEMDKEHYELIVRVNSLFVSFSNGTSDAEVQRLLGFLRDYVVYHFQHEEEMQLEANYFDYEKHKFEHEKLKQIVADLVEEMGQVGLTAGFKMKISRILVDWLKSHIGGEDKRFAEYLMSQQV